MISSDPGTALRNFSGVCIFFPLEKQFIPGQIFSQSVFLECLERKYTLYCLSVELGAKRMKFHFRNLCQARFVDPIFKSSLKASSKQLQHYNF